MSFEVKLKRLSHRDWLIVNPEWLPHIAQLTITSPGLPPNEVISDFYALGEISPQVPQDGEYRANLTGFRAALLHEAIYLLHKAANVLVASQQQVRGGLPTWSIATAYQSSFFSKEALLMLLGVAFVEVNNKTLLLDIWPEPEKSATKKAKALYKVGSEIQYVHHSRIEHHHRWAVLKRVLRTLRNSPINGKIINAIDDIDDKKFARQRNDLHYSNAWYFKDMHSFFSPISYCRFQKDSELVDRLDPDNQDFTVVLAMILFSCASSLLSSLSTLAPLIAAEYELLNHASSYARMPLREEYESATGTSMV